MSSYILILFLQKIKNIQDVNYNIVKLSLNPTYETF